MKSVAELLDVNPLGNSSSGHMAVMALMKRHTLLVRCLRPAQVDALLLGDEPKTRWESVRLPPDDKARPSATYHIDDKGRHTKRWTLPDRKADGSYCKVFCELYASVTRKQLPPSMDAEDLPLPGGGMASPSVTRADLYRMAQWLVREIDRLLQQHPERAEWSPWWPDGWQRWHDLVKHGRQPAAAPPARTAAQLAASKTSRHAVLAMTQRDMARRENG